MICTHEPGLERPVRLKLNEDIIAYRHYFDNIRYEWLQEITIGLFGMSHVVRSEIHSDEYWRSVTFTGDCLRVVFKLYENCDMSTSGVEVDMNVTKYEHYFDEAQQRGIHRFTRTDGIIDEYLEEQIGTLKLIDTRAFEHE